MFLSTTLVFAVSAQAGVNSKNGNFFISYTDIIVTIGTEEFDVTRTYNSKATQNLSYGYGSNLDTRLIVNGDGSVSVQEVGSGKIYNYVPATQSQEKLNALLDNMMLGIETGGWLASEYRAREVRAELSRDAELRRSVYLSLVRRGLVDPVDIAVGTRFVATSGEQQGVEIFLEPGGYYRRSRNGFERFNLRGQLMETALNDKAYFRLIRDGQGHLREIVLSDDSRIEITTNGDGKIVRMRYGSSGFRAVAVYRRRDPKTEWLLIAIVILQRRQRPLLHAPAIPVLWVQGLHP